MPSADGAHHWLLSTSARNTLGGATFPARSAAVIGHMLGWSIVATVAAQPASQVEKAGNPLEEIDSGSGALLRSVVRRVLKGLYAAELFVDPPSAACHSSRLSTFACVAGAASPCSTHSSQPAGSMVSPGAATTAVGVAPARDETAPRPSAAISRARTIRALGMKRGMGCLTRLAPRP